MNGSGFPLPWSSLNVGLSIPLPVLTIFGEHMLDSVFLLKKNLGSLTERNVQCGVISKFDEDLHGGPNSFVSRFQMGCLVNILICRRKERLLEFGTVSRGKRLSARTPNELTVAYLPRARTSESPLSRLNRFPIPAQYPHSLCLPALYPLGEEVKERPPQHQCNMLIRGQEPQESCARSRIPKCQSRHRAGCLRRCSYAFHESEAA